MRKKACYNNNKKVECVYFTVNMFDIDVIRKIQMIRIVFRVKIILLQLYDNFLLASDLITKLSMVFLWLLKKLKLIKICLLKVNILLLLCQFWCLLIFCDFSLFLNSHYANFVFFALARAMKMMHRNVKCIAKNFWYCSIKCVNELCYCSKINKNL